MKNTITTFIAVTISTFTAYAGSPSIEVAAASLPEAPVASTGSFFEDMKEWAVQPTLTARARYEYRAQQGLEASNAGTISLSPGLKTKSFNGFSAAVEGEFTYALLDDYQSGGQSTLTPFNPGNTAILDPETEELNQAFLAYSGNGFSAKVGRQRIILDNAAHVGNVGWRQNEQTYDAATIGYKTDAFELSYSYITEAHRIFGSDATGAVGTLESDEGSHLISADFSIGAQKVGAYAYLLDFDKQGAWATSNTYGAHTTLDLGAGSLYAEYAYQDGGINPGGTNAYDGSNYAHLIYSQKVAGLAGSVGLEFLGDDFSTPLATVHAFNGFADAFIGPRLNLPGTDWEGLIDVYASVVKTGLPGGLVFKGFLHYYMDQDWDANYGWEADAVVAKKLNDQATIVSKFAYFFADNDTQFVDDIAQASIQLDFQF